MSNNIRDLMCRIPLGTSDFISLRMGKGIYVDKTRLIYNLTRLKKVFLIRPRRFGKSLLVSTLETLFRDGIKWFDGLYISKYWKEDVYKVLKLDFSSVKDFSSIDSFVCLVREMINESFIKCGFSSICPENEHPRMFLRKFFAQLKPLSLVLLIDEYDSPLTYTLKDKNLFEEVRSFLSQFYSIIKSNDGSIKFLFLTGITRFSKANIFSSMNNLSDISMKKEFSTILGYTEEEIILYFQPYIEYAAKIMNKTKEEIIKNMRNQYDGFCFDKDVSSHVYAPWSVLSFFMFPDDGLENYWYETSGRPNLLLSYLKQKEVFNINQYNSNFYLSMSDLQSSNDFETIKDSVLLLQSGYLTIKGFQDGNFLVGYPNKEVASSIATLSIESMLNGKNKADLGIENIKNRLEKNNPEDIIDLFNSTFLHIPYEKYPISNESTCRAVLLALLAGAGIFPLAERENSFGRSDIEVVLEKIHWVFEIKFLKSSGSGAPFVPDWTKDRKTREGSLKMLAQALEQIRARQYGASLLPGLPLVCVALVFSEAARKIVDWETYPLIKKTPPYKSWPQALSKKLQKDKSGAWTPEMLAVLQSPQKTEAGTAEKK